jgi:protein involved in polysaccharide export with SLBB domain
MRFYRYCLVFLAVAIRMVAADVVAAPEPKPAEPRAGELRYHLFVRDLIRIAIHGEPDMGVDRRVDGLGEINVPLLGQLKVVGLTLAEVQALIAKRYVDGEIFIHPEVVITVVEYCPKEIMVLGQIGKQGKQVFPPEAPEISIVEAITSAGGFSRIAKSDAVRVTRKDDKGNEQSFTVNVEKMIEGRSTPGETFSLQPGDVVFVPERVF